MSHIRLATLATILCMVSALTAGAQEIYFGTLHSHSCYSDGTGTPEEAFRYAREQGRLDFMALTDHNHELAEQGAAERADGLLIAKDHSLYEGPRPDSLVETARRMTRDGAFVALCGQEVSSISKGNHVNAFEVPAVVDVPNGRFDLLLREWLPAHPDSTGKPPILQFNHARELKNKALEYGLDDFAGPADWLAAIQPHVCLMEMMNGPAMVKTGGFRPTVMESEYLDYLNRGVHLAPSANQDNHYATWGTSTDARTAVITTELTRDAVLEALRQRRVYASEDRDLRALFRIGGRLAGAVVTPPPDAGTLLPAECSLADDDDPGASFEVETWTDRVGGEERARPVARRSFTAAVAARGWLALDPVRYEGGCQYVFFKVRRVAPGRAAARAWSAPTWFEPAAGPIAEPGFEDAWADLFVAAAGSAEYHVTPLCVEAKRIAGPNCVQGPAARYGRSRHAGCRPSHGKRPVGGS